MKSVNSHAEFKWNMTSEHWIQVRSREFKLHEHTIIFTDDLCFYWRATSGSHLVPPADLLTETNAVWGRYLDNHIPLHQAKNVQSKSCKTASIGGLLKIPASEIQCGTSFLEEKTDTEDASNQAHEAQTLSELKPAAVLLCYLWCGSALGRGFTYFWPCWFGASRSIMGRVIRLDTQLSYDF